MNRYYGAIFGLAVGMVLTAAIIAVFIASNIGEPQAAAVEIESGYIPFSGCPGDSATFTSTLTINRKAIIFVTVSHLRAGGDTIIGGKIGDTFITAIPSPRTTVDQDNGFSLPDLPPGDYVRVVAIGTKSEDSLPVMIEQPYTIEENCEQAD